MQRMLDTFSSYRYGYFTVSRTFDVGPGKRTCGVDTNGLWV